MADPTKGDAGFNAAGVRRFDAGRPISAGQLNRLAAHSTAAQARTPIGGLYSSGPYGTIIHAARGARASSVDHPFKVIDASDANGPKVRVSPGTVSGARWPTIGGVSIAAEPPPTLATPETGWIVMTSTWADDHVPRSLPLSVAIVFQSGDIAADYVPPAADSRTTARLVIGSVKVANGAITAATSFLSWHIVMTRVVYGNAAEHVRFDALRL